MNLQARLSFHPLHLCLSHPVYTQKDTMYSKYKRQQVNLKLLCATTKRKTPQQLLPSDPVPLYDPATKTQVKQLL